MWSVDFKISLSHTHKSVTCECVGGGVNIKKIKLNWSDELKYQ